MRRLSLVLVILPGAAHAVEVRLAGAGCPAVEGVEARWAGGAGAIEVEVVGEGLVGRVRVPQADGAVIERQIEARRGGCPALVDALLTAGALLAPLDAPIEAPIEVAPPRPAPPPEPAPIFEPTAEAAAPTRPVIAARSHAVAQGAVEASIAPGVELGAAPGPLARIEARVAGRWGALGVGGGAQAGWAPEAAVEGGAVALDRYAAVGFGCWRPGAWALCGEARAGGVVVRPRGLDGAARVELDAAAGLRVGYGWAVGPAAVGVEIGADAPLRPLRLTVGGEAVWRAWPVTPWLAVTAGWGG